MLFKIGLFDKGIQQYEEKSSIRHIAFYISRKGIELRIENNDDVWSKQACLRGSSGGSAPLRKSLIVLPLQHDHLNTIKGAKSVIITFSKYVVYQLISTLNSYYQWH